MTDLKSFLAVKTAPASVEPPRGDGGAPGNVYPGKANQSPEQRPSATDEHHLNSDSDAVAQYVARNTTPSGIEVEYEAHPKRLYRVNGEEVPSVTTVLDCLAKNSLPWWGMQVGVRGVLELLERRVLQSNISWGGNGELWVIGDDTATDESIVKALTAEKLTVNHVVNRAADRGVAVHDALEQWAQTGGEFFPTPQSYGDEEKPYVEAMLSWLDVCDGDVVPVLCEVMVGSAEHGFAGRFDLVIEVWKEKTFTLKNYKRKDNLTVDVKPGRYIVDAKTSKSTYPTHHMQLAAYELAAVEGGYDATDGQFILRLGADGLYEFVPSVGTAAQFLAVKGAYDATKGLK